MAMPAILGFIIFTSGPMVASLVFSFTDWTIGGPMSFVGVDNYREMVFDDPLFIKSLVVTTYFTLGTVPLMLVVGFVIALMLNQRVRGQGVFRTVYYLPTLVPSVASAVLWIWIFNPDFGLLNSMLRSLGLPTSQWIHSESMAIP
jgi:multiple sugar transport system permease protein